MIGKKRQGFLVAATCFWAALAGLACTAEPDFEVTPRLKLAGIIPREGSVEPRSGLYVLATFNAAPLTGNDADETNLSLNTFYLETEDQKRVDAVFSFSPEGVENPNAATLKPTNPASLAPGKVYIVIAHTIKGQDTEEIGADIRSWIEVLAQ